MGILVCLGHVGWDPKLLDIFVIAWQIFRHGHAVLGVQGVRHSHRVTSRRSHVSQSKSAAHWRGTRMSVVVLIRVDRERAAFVPTGRSQRWLAVHAGWGW